VTRLRQVMPVDGKGSATTLVTLNSLFPVCVSVAVLRMTEDVAGPNLSSRCFSKRGVF